MNWLRWNWLDGLILPLLLTALRSSWLWLWLAWAQRWLTPSHEGLLLPWPLLAVVPLSSLALARWGEARQPPNGPVPLWSRLSMAGAGLLMWSLLLWWLYYGSSHAWWELGWWRLLGRDLSRWDAEVPAPFLTLLASGYLWVRGILDGQDSLSHESIWAAFRAGLLALALYVLMGGAGTLSSGALAPILLFFGAGMAALAAAGLKLAQGLDGAPTWGRAASVPVPTSRYWLFSVVGAVLFLIGLGLALALLVAPESLARLFQWLSIVPRALLQLLGLLFLGLGYLMVLLLLVLIQIFGPLWELLRGTPEVTEREPQVAPTVPLQELLEGGAAVLPDWVPWVGVSLVAVGLLLLSALVLRRRTRRAVTVAAELRESIFSVELLQAQLSAAWQRWLLRLRDRVRRSAPYLSLDDEPQAQRRIRVAYQRLLAQARAQGLPRLRGQTPRAYARTLDRAQFRGQEPRARLTAAYLAARYGPDPPDAAQVEQAEEAWAELQAAAETEPAGPQPAA